MTVALILLLLAFVVALVAAFIGAVGRVSLLALAVAIYIASEIAQNWP